VCVSSCRFSIASTQRSLRTQPTPRFCRYWYC
jgi:hypothetical protein